MKWRPSFTRTAIIEKDMAMNRDTRTILEEVRAGTLSVEDACLEFKQKPFADIGYAKVDLHRRVRQGVPEIIYGAGKSAEQIIAIAATMRDNGQLPVIITRIDKEKAVAVIERHSSHEWWPTAGDLLELSYSRDGRLFTWGGDDHENMSGMQ